MSCPQDLSEFVERWVKSSVKDPWSEFCAPGALFIRPSGNPMGEKIWTQMMGSDDVNQKFHNLLGINRYISIDDNNAVICLTTHAQFEYKGTPNDDVSVYTLVVSKASGSWKITHAQRSTGRKPDEAAPNFDCE